MITKAVGSVRAIAKATISNSGLINRPWSRGTSPAAKGRLHLERCCLSLGRSSRSLRMYTLEAHRPKQTNATAACQINSGLSSRSEEHTSELQSQFHLVCRLLL